MSTDILNNQISELKQALADVQGENKELTDKLSKANVEGLEKQIAEFTETVDALGESHRQINESLETEVSKSEELEAKLSAETDARTKAEDLIQSMEKEKAKADRMLALIEAGLSEEEAAAKIDLFDNLNDEQFEAMAETLKSAYNYKKKMASDDDDEEDKKKGKSDAEDSTEAAESEPENHEEAEAEASEVDEEVLETASVEETIDMSVASEDTEDESNQTRANLREWVNTYVLDQELGE